MYRNYKELIKLQKLKYSKRVFIFFIALLLLSLFLYEAFRICNRNIAFLIIFSIISSIFCLINIFKNLYFLTCSKNYGRKLEDSDANRINKELEHIIDYREGECILTNNYVIILRGKIKLVSYEEIILIDNNFGIKMGDNRNPFRLYVKLFILTKHGKKYFVDLGNVFVSPQSYNTIEFNNEILTKNKDILFGKTKENKTIILEKYGIKI